MQTQHPLIVAWGGGMNSTAMPVGMRERNVVPVLSLFADTKGEKPETYAYLDTLRAWLATARFPELLVVDKNAMYESLEDQCLRTKTPPSLAYGWKSCSDKWKRQPQDKFCNHWPPAMDTWKSPAIAPRRWATTPTRSGGRESATTVLEQRATAEALETPCTCFDGGGCPTDGGG